MKFQMTKTEMDNLCIPGLHTQHATSISKVVKIQKSVFTFWIEFLTSLSMATLAKLPQIFICCDLTIF